MPYAFGAATAASDKKDKISRLFNHATKLEQAWFSGSAPTYIYSYVGDPAYGDMAVAVRAWIKDLWTDYATRKAQVLGAVDDAWRGVSEDFSSHGDPPHTIWDFP